MKSKFLPKVNTAAIKKAQDEKDYTALYDLLAQPLHEELYRQGSFEFVDTLLPIQRLLIAYDYVRAQAGQGGFIQFIQNGYVSLLPDLIEQLYQLKAADMAKVLDDVLKVYVLNRALIKKQTTVQEFAALYNELKEFEEIDARYNTLNESTIQLIADHILSHLEEFCSC